MYYCLGFLFDEQDRVALVQKTRGPVELHGKWNGIGGGLDPYEAPHEGMTREFEEETGIPITDWKDFGSFVVGPAKIFLFAAKYSAFLDLPDTNDVGEKLAWFGAASIEHHTENNTLPKNLAWLLPMARYRLDNNLWTLTVE
jgi:8-oxo-dGTP pyrophosphatase MutT (NUDIX family)